MIYYKRYTGKLLPQKTAEQPSWVQWTHHSEGKTHCEECLMLDGCWFQEENAPSCPHHPYCHCTLDPIPYAVVLMNGRTGRENPEKLSQSIQLDSETASFLVDILRHEFNID